MKQPSEKLAKKPYQSPKLLVYGDLKEMTRSNGGVGKLDKHGPNPQKIRTGSH
jgi:hypothetical protein